MRARKDALSIWTKACFSILTTSPEIIISFNSEHDEKELSVQGNDVKLEAVQYLDEDFFDTVSTIQTEMICMNGFGIMGSADVETTLRQRRTTAEGTTDSTEEQIYAAQYNGFVFWYKKKQSWLDKNDVPKWIWWIGHTMENNKRGIKLITTKDHILIFKNPRSKSGIFYLLF